VPSGRNHPLAFAIILCAVCVEVPASPVHQRDQEPQPVLRATTELVKIDVMVQDKRGNFLDGLTQSDFRVLEDGKDQPIVFFAPVEAPAQALVMVETSPAVYLIREQHLSALYALVDGLAADDQVALVAYDRGPRAILGFTPEKAGLAAALQQIQYTIGMGELNFYDSISTALDWLAPLHGKKALVLLTTGLDSSPPERWEALVQKLRGDDVVIFTVALGGSLRQAGDNKKKPPKAAPALGSQPDTRSSDSANPLSFAKADEGLTSMARMTGGRVYFPQSAGEFAPIYREIAAGLRHQYVLGIVPEHDARLHPLQVEVLGGTSRPSPSKSKSVEYRVLAREGYLAPAP
jgi:Ca-activated chloride channel family protein